MAADIQVPEVSTIDLRDFAVQQGIEGVGFYPSSGFVHIDVRPRRFWWVDYSLPGHQQSPIPDPEGNAPSTKSLPIANHDHRL
jgi:hypothetical protein